tara:strand:- start:118620 stop:119747 length:1128 start_codon:yes stop_codon:yes gene_type:complete
MQRSKVNFIVDGQWGSCGKGLIAGYLAEKHKVNVCSTNNMPNAGHTMVLEDGTKFISKILPVTAFLNTVGQRSNILIGPGAGFCLDRLFMEIERCGLDEEDVLIHPRAMVVTQEHAAAERGDSSGVSTKHIASTMQGCGTARAEKIMRGAHVELARDFDVLKGLVTNNGDEWFTLVHNILKGDKTMWLHEGSQGFSLGMNHGSHYPQCTSRECTTAREIADMGISHQKVGDVYLVIRPFPIRVGNVIEDGKEVGYSGDCYDDQEEISWADLKAQSGYPADFDLKELTTVTKRLRRCFTYSDFQVRMAAEINGATKIALNFANYLDYSIFQTSGNNIKDLPDKVRDFIAMIEDQTGLPVTLVGTGPGNNHVWDLEE